MIRKYLITKPTKILIRLNDLEIGGTIDKKSLIIKLFGHFDYFTMRAFDVHYYKARKQTEKKFVTKNSIILRVS